VQGHHCDGQEQDVGQAPHPAIADMSRLANCPRFCGHFAGLAVLLAVAVALEFVSNSAAAAATSGRRLSQVH